MKNLYLLLAILGAVLPYSYFISFLHANVLDIKLFTSDKKP
ncbi:MULTISPECIES: DUF2834 domain-containing protein [Brevibacillus]|nr:MULTISPECIES: DUF2834 domain-containing protein [Brevibacillus]